MALIRCDFSSRVLGLGTTVSVLLPQPAPAQIGLAGSAGEGPPPVLYLLHGLSDDHTAWTRYTSIERYAAERGVAVVMPQVHRSFYTNETHGLRFRDYLTEELPEVVHRFFRVSQRPEETFVAGLSMGGYGALKWALRQPERFAAAAALSGALDVARLRDSASDPVVRATVAGVFAGREPADTGDDLFELVVRADPAALPRLMLRCGTEDHLRADNERFVAACASAGVPLDSAFTPGAHEWGYWDEQIRAVLAWLRG